MIQTVDFLTKKCKKNEGELQQLYIEEDHEAIIPPDMWECVQLEILRRKAHIEKYSLKSYSRKAETNPFFGKVVCGECDSSFGRKTWINGKKSRQVWQCNERYRVKGVQGCTNRHIEESTLEQVFIIAWNALIDNISVCRENGINKPRTTISSKPTERRTF